jgi:translation initiation factor IF-2
MSLDQDVAIPGQSKLGSAASRTKLNAPKIKKSANREWKRKKVDVYIPSIVSVGQLARLLNVKLGTRIIFVI